MARFEVNNQEGVSTYMHNSRFKLTEDRFERNVLKNDPKHFANSLGVLRLFYLCHHLSSTYSRLQSAADWSIAGT